MRKSNLLKFTFLFAAILASTLLVQSKEIFLSSSGSDDNNGLAENSPLLTLTKALSLIDDNDIVIVSGIIDISSESTGTNGVSLPDKKITIDGRNNTLSGFSGNNKSRMLTINSNNKGCVIKNLTFKNGSSSVKEGIAVSVTNSNTQFENCIFTDNSGSRRDSNGTVYVKDGQNTSFTSCSFNNNNVLQGGAFYVEGGSVKIINATIEDNNLSYSSSLGGGLFISNCKDLLLQNSVIKSCTTDDGGTGIYIIENDEENKIVSNIRVESCLIANNTSKSGSGVGFNVNNETPGNEIHLSVINTTLYNNVTTVQSGGGAICFNEALEGSSVSLVNCTVVRNRIGGDADRGAGIYFSNKAKDIKKNIFNCIIESNIASKNSLKSSDLAFRYTVENEKDLFIYNSYIGGAYNDSQVYVPLEKNNNRTEYQLGEFAELATPFDDFIVSQGSIPLEYNSPSLYHGDAKYLKDLNISTDQNGNTRTFTNNKCAIGAVEKPTSPPVGVESHDYQHFIMYGQSLSTGHEAYPVSTENVEGNYMLGNQIWINYGNQNPSELMPLVANYSMATTELSEAPLHGAVNHIRLKQKEQNPNLENRFIATSAGTSGMPIEDLSKESQVSSLYSDYQIALKYGKRIATQSNSTITCPAIFWLQGEWNYQGHGNGLTYGSKPTADKDEYKELMVKLKNNMQNEVQERYLQAEKPIFYTYQVGAQYSKGLRLNIGMAQVEASNQYDDIVCIGPVYPMTDVGGHLDGNGYRWYGEMIGKVYYKTKVLGEDFKPLQPKELLRDPNNLKKIRIVYHVPAPPIVLDDYTLKKIADYGFKVYHNNRSQEIASIEVVDGNTIEITTVGDLTGRVLVNYAGESVSGHGNVRDSDDYQAFFNYENPDKKDENGEFVFPHGTKTSLIPPSGEPKDENGNVIYEKPYPLYNFSIGFAYEILDGESKFTVPYMDGGTSISTIKKDEITISQFSSSLFVSVPKVDGDVTIELFDISGKMVEKINDKSFSSRVLKEIPLYSLNQGVYIVKVTTLNNMKTSKIILSR